MTPTTASHEWDVSSTDPDGGTWSTQIIFGSLRSGSHLMDDDISAASSICDPNPTTDAAIPFDVITTSTNTGINVVSGDTAFTLVNQQLSSTALTESDPAGEALTAALNFGGNGSFTGCQNIDKGKEFGQPIDGGLSGQREAFGGAIFLKGWASGSHPNGDPAWLNNIYVRVPAYDTDAMSRVWRTTGVSGPSVFKLANPTAEDDNAPANGWFFQIAGRPTKPDCTALPSTGYDPAAICRALP